MAQKAVVIRTYGDPAMSDAIANGMARAMPAAELEAVKAEMRAMRAREAVLGVRVVRDRDYWATKCTEAAYYYGQDREPGKLARALLGMWALAWLEISEWIEYLRRINRGE